MLNQACRTRFLVALVSGVWTIGCFAQIKPSDKIRQVTAVEYFSTRAMPAMRALIVGQFMSMGYIEGQNLRLDVVSLLGLSPEDQEAAMANVVRSHPDVIVVGGTSVAKLAAKTTQEIPIVMWASVDPVGAGLAQSLARPGGNVTGLATDVGAGAEVKRMELFLDMAPRSRRVAFVGPKVSWEDPWGKAVRSVAAQRKVDLIFAEGNSSNGFADSLEIAKSKHADALFVGLGPTTSQFIPAFVQFSLAHRLPMSCGVTEFADSGCTMAYGQSYRNFITYSLSYVDKILRGAKPGELPIEQPTIFKLVVNQKMANEIGHQVPQLILLRADRVIE